MAYCGVVLFLAKAAWGLRLGYLTGVFFASVLQNASAVFELQILLLLLLPLAFRRDNKSYTQRPDYAAAGSYSPTPSGHPSAETWLPAS